MGYNPEENRFEPLPTTEAEIPVDKRDWKRFQEGEFLFLKGIQFALTEVGENRLVLRPIKQA